MEPFSGCYRIEFEVLQATDGDGAYVGVIKPDANARTTAAQFVDVNAHITDEAPRSADDVVMEEGGGSSEATVVPFDEWQDANVVEEMIEDDTVIESWLARLRPSPSDLAAGAATIASPELKQHRRMLRYVGERSASKMLGEKVGAPPGRDPSADAAWLYLADPDRRPEFEMRAENAGRLVPPERKADVMRWIAELLTPRGLRRLRALAQELWVHAGSPCASATGQPIAVADVNWPACWAWCVAPTLPNRWRTRSDGHDTLTLLCATLCPRSGIATSRPPPPARCTSPAVCCSFSSGV
jgi:hypothetical protein